MNIGREELGALLGLLEITAVREIDCEEFLVLLPGYLERVRDGRRVACEHAAVQQHLEICPECREEVDGLMDAVDEGLL